MATTLLPAIQSELEQAYSTARDQLLNERGNADHWTGELAASSLSTATAVSALALARTHYPEVPGDLPTREHLTELINRGITWLADHQNQDGGWGDTDRSYSNIATTLLVIAAFKLAEQTSQHLEPLQLAQAYVDETGIEAGLRSRYGNDKTFAIPILTNAALAGMVPWKKVSALPFELACFPSSFYRFLRLPVVSYAIPALVAIGQARFFHRRPWNPIVWFFRRLAVGRSLKVLQRMQPASGGYLEAIPLTSFVIMSLVSTGRVTHSVSCQGIQFLTNTIRQDGSWPIDSDLATWNTSIAINALSRQGEDVAALGATEWLLNCQHQQRHPFTGAAPGGWGWSDLSGAVPDGDDTPSAILALDAIRRSASFEPSELPRIKAAAMAGIQWMLGLQNRDHGWPTFCRGWGKLPFDRSGTDLTAHALRALHAWQDELRAPGGLFHNQPDDLMQLVHNAFGYLDQKQNSDGSWYPLWFGNQHRPDEENPVYGTAKVLLAYHAWGKAETDSALAGYQWLVDHVNPDNGWGNRVETSLDEHGRICLESAGSSIEETALAIETLLTCPDRDLTQIALNKGLERMVGSVQNGKFRECSAIGFYFAKLWYHERLYPILFTVSALGSALSVKSVRPTDQPNR